MALSIRSDRLDVFVGSYRSTLNAVFVFVSISVMTGDFASDGRITLFTEFLTSSITSFTFALVFVVITILDIPSDEFEVILSIHFISFISLYILSVISLSISFQA